MARPFQEQTAVILSRRTATAQEEPHGVDATQIMPEHNLHFLCRLYKDYGLYETSHLVSLKMWSSV